MAKATSKRSTSSALRPSKSSGPATKNEVGQNNPFKKFLLMLGPGFITGASDDDPSGIGTYAQTGAQFGFAPLWLALFTFPLMTGIQFISGKIGMVSGMGLSGVLRRYYSRWVLYPAVTGLLIANTINAGADIGAVAAAIAIANTKIRLKFPIALTDSNDRNKNPSCPNPNLSSRLHFPCIASNARSDNAPRSMASVEPE